MAPNGYSLRVVGVPQSRETVQIVSTYPASPEARAPSFFGGKPVMQPRSMARGAPAPYGRHWVYPGPKSTLKTLLHTLTKYTKSPVQPSQSSPPSLYPAHSPPHLSNPLCKTHPHTTEYIFNCTHLYTSSNILDLWMSPRRVVPLLARGKGRQTGLP